MKRRFKLKKGSASPSIKCVQFLLTLTCASTVHKVQDLSLEKGVIDFSLQNQKSVGPGEVYTMLSRVKTYGNLYCIGEFKRSALKLNKDERCIAWIGMPETEWFIFHSKKKHYFRWYSYSSCL